MLDAAIAVLESEGEAAIRVGDLAAAVKITKPSVYHFFGDREGLVVAALAEMYHRTLSLHRERLMEIARSCTNREQFAEALFSIVASFSSEDGVRRRATRMEVLGAAVSRPELQAALVQMHREHDMFMVEFFMVGRERGLMSLSFDPHTAARWTSAMVLGRHFAEIDPAADRVEWDALTRETLAHLLFGEADQR